jgi:hypothetical protein
MIDRLANHLSIIAVAIAIAAESSASADPPPPHSYSAAAELAELVGSDVKNLERWCKGWEGTVSEGFSESLCPEGPGTLCERTKSAVECALAPRSSLRAWTNKAGRVRKIYWKLRRAPTVREVTGMISFFMKHAKGYDKRLSGAFRWANYEGARVTYHASDREAELWLEWARAEGR